ncbi:MAG: hypothetical protein FWH59_01785 [Lentimicrobiaceae bacterium]|nr:hypothetical protein [Lentimicrobiaceae bacterium]
MNILLTFIIFFIFNNLHSQIDTAFIPVDTIYELNDTILISQDTIVNVSEVVDSLATDSLPPKKRLSKDALESSVKYISQDSIIISLRNKIIFLFEEAKAYYEDIELNAAFMEFGFASSELYASGVADSSGHVHGPPVFKESGSEFSSQEIRYNFNTKKGKVTKVITNEGDGYVHGHYVKHVDEKTSYVKGGQYTTCNLEHPHFQIRFNKGKLIQDEKIITGPAYLSFGNVPSPLALPFSYFPLQKERSSGIVIPRIGESANRGFYFEDFGYYLGISDNFDLLLSGDITTRGSWATKAKANYVFRYKCNGTLELGFAQNFMGEKETPSRSHTNDFRVFWKHNQDPKSHPTTRFSAHVNILSTTYNKYNPSTTSDYLSNQFNSSINFSTNLKSVFFFDAALYYNQNTQSRTIGISLPDLNMSVNQFYPFRKKLKAGKLKWYDNISLKWSSQMTNRINTTDTLFMKPQTWQEMQSGIKHNVPLNIPVKVGKGFNWNTNATFTEIWYLQREPQFFSLKPEEDTVVPHLDHVFQRGFYALHNLSLSTSLTTKIYGNYAFKKGVFQARHVMSPDLSFTLTPNLSGNSYGTYFNTITGEEVEYSYFPGAIYGAGTSRLQAITRFTLNNNLELKVRSKKDTITGTQKITIFDNVGISCGYDFAADSLHWQPLTINGRTSLFSFLDVTFGLSFDPYIINSEGRRINQKEIKVNQRAMRFSGSDLRIGLNWRLNQDFFKSKKKTENSSETTSSQSETVFPENSLGAAPSMRPDFSNPWNITINYTFAYITSDNLIFYSGLSNKKYDTNLLQTVNIAVDVSITRKWKIQVTTGYDIQQKDFSFTNIKIYRDLHCWEMALEWIPFGYQKGWKFQINVKAPVLQDLKYEMKRDFRDNLY